MKPNPSNVQTQERIAASEARIKMYVSFALSTSPQLIIYRLKEQRDQWKALSKPPLSISPIIPKKLSAITPSHIDASLLDPEQAAILDLVTTHSADSLRANAQQRLQELHSRLEFKVDQFADGVHKLEQYQNTVGRVADRILALCAHKLEERDRKEKESVGTRDVPMQEVLRSLSRILPDER
jgi:kinetochore protein Mis13/DSN1